MAGDERPNNALARANIEVLSDDKLLRKYGRDRECYAYLGTTAAGLGDFWHGSCAATFVLEWAPPLMGRLCLSSTEGFLTAYTDSLWDLLCERHMGSWVSSVQEELRSKMRATKWLVHMANRIL